jgi:hypothetical protein
VKEDDVNELIQKLGRQRMSIEEIRTERDDLRSQLNASNLGMLLQSTEAILKMYQSDADVLESQIRAEALAVYAADGNKKPHAAVSVKEFTVLDYDPKLALEYCVTHWPAALKLNTTAFEKISKIARPEFVTEHVEPRAQIATDLSVYVDVAEVPDEDIHTPDAADETQTL